MGYFVWPRYKYQTCAKSMNAGNFKVHKITDSLNQFGYSIAVTNAYDDFQGFFSSSTLDLTDTALSSNLNERNKKTPNIDSFVWRFEYDRCSKRKCCQRCL